MVGFYATADSSKPIRTDLDNELEDVQWYTREEILAVLRHPSGTTFGGREYRTINDIRTGPDMDRSQEGTTTLAHSIPSVAAKEMLTATASKVGTRTKLNEEELPFKVPSITAIAGILIQHWAEGEMQRSSTNVQKDMQSRC